MTKNYIKSMLYDFILMMHEKEKLAICLPY